MSAEESTYVCRMTESNVRVNWFAGFIAALVMSVVFWFLWDDWFFAVAIGVMLGIVAAYVFKPRPPE